MQRHSNRDDEREATRKLNAARQAKHDAPYAARVLSDPQTFGPTATYRQNVAAFNANARRGGSWS
jgi:hypothetical protein